MHTTTGGRILALAIWLVCSSTWGAQAERFIVDSEAVSEASGAAVSRRNPDILWVHNDSGDLPVLYAIDTRGHFLGRVDILGAQAFDWEDIAAFELHGEPYLLIADVGDNFGIRPLVTLYLLPEPEIADAGADFTLEAKVTRRVNLRYPDGPHDVEAVAVDTADGYTYLLTKKDDPPVLYRVPLQPFEREHTTVAQRVTAVETLPGVSDQDTKQDPVFGRFRAQPSALDISADGRVWLVTTYKRGYLYRRAAKQTVAQMLSKRPRFLTVPQLPQMEAGALSPDLHRGYFTSEQHPTELVTVPID